MGVARPQSNSPARFGVRREAQRHAALVNVHRATRQMNRRGAETRSGFRDVFSWRCEVIGRSITTDGFESGVDAPLCHRTPKLRGVILYPQRILSAATSHGVRKRRWGMGGTMHSTVTQSPIFDLRFPLPRSRRGDEADHPDVGRHPPFYWGCLTAIQFTRTFWSAAGSAAPRRFGQRPPRNTANEPQRRGDAEWFPGCVFMAMRGHRSVYHHRRFRKRCRRSALPPHSKTARHRSIANRHGITHPQISRFVSLKNQLLMFESEAIDKSPLAFPIAWLMPRHLSRQRKPVAAY